MQNIGLIGAAVMGSNLALNMANHGYSVAVYSRTAEHVRHFIEGAAKGRTSSAATRWKNCWRTLKSRAASC